MSSISLSSVNVRSSLRRAKLPRKPVLVPVPVPLNGLEYFYFPYDRMLHRHRPTPQHSPVLWLE